MAKAKKEKEETSVTSSEKKDITDILFEQFNKEYPESPLEHLDESDLASIPGWISTSNYALNWAISKSVFKGLPMGRVSIFSGANSAGKTMIAACAAKDPTIDTIVYFDSEGGGLTKEFTDFLGVSPSKILYSQIDTVEDLIKKFGTLIDTLEKNKTRKNVLLIVDSISMLTTEREKDPEAGSDMGNKAKLMRTFFRQYARKMQSLRMGVLMPAHLTQNIGGYGPAEVVAGGTIVGYVASLEVRLSIDNANSETEKSARGMTMQKTRADIIKSRFGTRGKRVSFDFDSQKGLTPYSGLFEILRDYQFIIPATADVEKQIKDKMIPKKGTGWWMFKPWVGTGKGDDEATSPLTVEYYKRFIEEGLTSDQGKFREGDIANYCRKYDWFLIEYQRLLDTIDEEPAPEFEVAPVKEPEEENTSVEITEVPAD